MAAKTSRHRYGTELRHCHRQTQWSAHSCYRAEEISLVVASAAGGMRPVSAIMAWRTSASKRSGCLTTDVELTMLRSPPIRATNIDTVYLQWVNQPPSLCRMKKKYQPKCTDALWPRRKGRTAHSVYGLTRCWLHYHVPY